MTALRTYRPGDPEHVRLVSRDDPFATLDPGAEGALLGWLTGPAWKWPLAPNATVPITRDAGGADIAARKCAELGVRVLIVEDQYLGRKSRNFQTTKKLILTCGMIIGRILERCEIDDVVFCQASTWQTGKPQRADSKKWSIQRAARRFPLYLRSLPGSLRSGSADALGLADWFAAGVRNEEG